MASFTMAAAMARETSSGNLRTHLQRMETFSRELPHGGGAAADDSAHGSKKGEETTGHLSLGDFMNLAYTLSTMYKRVHPERRATSDEARRVKYYNENAVLIVLAVFIVVAACFGVFLLTDRLTCRPISMDAATFATSAANYYGMKYIESVCETEIKVRQHGGYTVLAVTLIVLGCGLVGLNKVCLDKMNRLHAIARGDIYSEVMGGEPVREDENPGQFATYTVKLIIFKTLITLGCVGGFVYYCIYVDSRGDTTIDNNGNFNGGSILSKYGALCDGNAIKFEDKFGESYRCHFVHEATMEYLKAVVYFFGGVLMLVMLGMLATLCVFYADYCKWRREVAAARAAAEARTPEEAAAIAAAEENASVDASLVRSMRIFIRIAMGYFAAEPPEGMPDLLAKVIVGKPPTRDELASMARPQVGRLVSLDRPLPEEVADVMYALLNAAMGRGCGDPGDMKELLVSAACAWTDSERQQYMRGMLDVLKQQNRARRQTGGIGPRVGALSARYSAGGGEEEVFVDARSEEAPQGELSREPTRHVAIATAAAAPSPHRTTPGGGPMRQR